MCVCMRRIQDPAAEIIVLQILEVLPHEASSSKLCVRPGRQREFIQELKHEAMNALRFLETSIQKYAQQQQQQQLKERAEQALIMAFRAVSSWVRIASHISPDVLVDHGTIQAAVHCLEHPNDEIREVAIDVLSDLIRITELVDIHKNPSERPISFKVLARLFGAVTSLFPRLKAIAAETRQARSLGAGEEDAVGDVDDGAKAIARLLADFGEAFLEIFANASDEGLKVAEIMLEVASFPHYQIGAIGFSFWNRLSTVLSQSNKEGNGDAKKEDDDSNDIDGERPRRRGSEEPIPESEMERRRAAFRPAFERLVDAIANRVAFPAVYSNWPKEAKQDFKRNRNAVADTISDSAYVLGMEATAVRLAVPLKGTASSIQARAAPEWRSTEAALYCFRAIGFLFNNSSSSILPQVGSCAKGKGVERKKKG